jgi:hypothetical protein
VEDFYRSLATRAGVEEGKDAGDGDRAALAGATGGGGGGGAGGGRGKRRGATVGYATILFWGGRASYRAKFRGHHSWGSPCDCVNNMRSRSIMRATENVSSIKSFCNSLQCVKSQISGWRSYRPRTELNLEDITVGDHHATV